MRAVETLENRAGGDETLEVLGGELCTRACCYMKGERNEKSVEGMIDPKEIARDGGLG